MFQVLLQPWLPHRWTGGYKIKKYKAKLGFDSVVVLDIDMEKKQATGAAQAG